MTMAAAIMEQRRLGLIAKAMLVVPGHCLAQAAREFLALYPNARILAADETNFTKDKRARFLYWAATATWDAIIITHSAFRFIAVPSAFEQQMIQDERQLYEDLLTKVDSEDRVAQAPRAAEGRSAGAARRTGDPQDDLLTISEIGVDQGRGRRGAGIPQAFFRHRCNMSTFGIGQMGAARLQDLLCEVRFIETRNPGRALVLPPVRRSPTRSARCFRSQRLLSNEALVERGLHRFDAGHPASATRRPSSRSAIRQIQAGQPLRFLRQCARTDRRSAR